MAATGEFSQLFESGSNFCSYHQWCFLPLISFEKLMKWFGVFLWINKSHSRFPIHFHHCLQHSKCLGKDSYHVDTELAFFTFLYSPSRWHWISKITLCNFWSHIFPENFISFPLFFISCRWVVAYNLVEYIIW